MRLVMNVNIVLLLLALSNGQVFAETTEPYADYSIRLTADIYGTITTPSGYGWIEIIHNSEWLRILQADNKIRSMVCRSLGFQFGSQPLFEDFGFDRREGTYMNITCSDDADNLADCAYTITEEYDYFDYDDQAYSNGGVDCYDVLIDGRSTNERQTGTVQYRYQDTVYNQCVLNWDINEQRILCFQIGYPFTTETTYSASVDTSNVMLTRWKCSSSYYDYSNYNIDDIHLWSCPSKYAQFGSSCTDDYYYYYYYSYNYDYGDSDSLVARIDCSECPQENYGYNCSYACGHCAGGERCHQKTGRCASGCEPFYINNTSLSSGDGYCHTYIAPLNTQLARPEVLLVQGSSVVLRYWFSDIIEDPEFYMYYRFVIEIKKSDESDEAYRRYPEEMTQQEEIPYQNITLTDQEEDETYHVRLVLYRRLGDNEDRCAGTESDAVIIQMNPSNNGSHTYKMAFIAILVISVLLIALVVLGAVYIYKRRNSSSASGGARSYGGEMVVLGKPAPGSKTETSGEINRTYTTLTYDKDKSKDAQKPAQVQKSLGKPDRQTGAAADVGYQNIAMVQPKPALSQKPSTDPSTVVSADVEDGIYMVPLPDAGTSTAHPRKPMPLPAIP